jgi:general nucleoside transport system permease protein
VPDLLNQAFLGALVSGALLAAVPILLAALGETVSEQTGVLNVGLEGMMLAGAYAGFVTALHAGSPWLGLLAGLTAGLAVAVVMALGTVWLRLDQIVVGIALFLLAEGVTSILHHTQLAGSYPRLAAFPRLSLPFLERIPVLGAGVFDQPAVVYFTVLLAGLLHWLLVHDRRGLLLRAAGEAPRALDAAGHSVTAARFAGVLTAGCLAGLGGAYLSVAVAGIFVPFMTQGAGFIAIVLAMLGRGRPFRVVLGALLFGAAVSAATALQLVGVRLPQDLVNMLPFVVVLVALALMGRRAYLPAALGAPYPRRSRPQRGRGLKGVIDA